MDIVKGKISVEIIEDGSKSQGEIAYINCNDSEKRYVIYRAGMLPQNDTFLCSLVGTAVVLHGKIEDNGYFCVESIASDNGKEIPLPEMVFSGLSKSIFIDNGNMENGCSKKTKRIPRKLKKILKKQKK